MKKNIFITSTLAVAASIGALVASCGDFLEITPLNGIVVENYWEKQSEVESVITSCYYHMQDKGVAQRVIAWGELRGDNLTETSTMEAKEKELYDYFTNNITPNNSWTSWADFYNVINLCNTVLHYAPQAQAKDGNYSVEELHTHEAEVKCIRALCYFYLIRTFKKVPLVTWATIGDDESFAVAASTEDDILKQIIEDLEWAEDYVWNKNFFEDTAERKGRFNKQSAKALLADIYLWKGDYARCAEYCKDIMDEKMAEYKALQDEAQGGGVGFSEEGRLALYNGYPLLDASASPHYPYTMLFETGNSFESIFELQYDYADRSGGNEGIMFFYGDHSNVSGRVNAAAYLTNQTTGSLFADVSDLRLEENTGYGGMVSNSYPVYKFRFLYDNGSERKLRTTAENWIVYRLTDVMLMRAEALAYLGGDGNCEEAFGIVKAVNMRACKGRSSLVYEADNMKKIVLDERQRELMFEGKRWYDLMRMVRHADNPVNAMSTLRSAYLQRKYGTGGRDAVARMGSLDNLYLPFYQKEMDVNPLLEQDQNPAYIIY